MADEKKKVDDRSLFQKLWDKPHDEIQKAENFIDGLFNKEDKGGDPSSSDPKFKKLMNTLNSLGKEDPEAARQFMRDALENNPDLRPDQQMRLKQRSDSYMEDTAPDYDAPTAFLEGGAPEEEPEAGAFPTLSEQETASELEEAELASNLVPAYEFLYGKGLPKTIEALKKSPNLYEGVSEIAFQLAKKQHSEAVAKGDQPDPSIFFGQGAMLEQMVDAVFEVAAEANVPGSTDRNQYAAAMQNTWVKAGKYILEEGDEEAQIQAQGLMESIVSDAEGGTGVMEKVADGTGQQAGGPNKTPLNEGIMQAMASRGV